MQQSPPPVVQHAPRTTRSLRIAIVSETFAPEVNGVAMTLGRLAKGLVRRGHQVQIVRPSQGPGDHVMPGDVLDQVHVRGLPIPGYGGLRFGLPARHRLQSLWREHRPDLVHVATEGPLGWSAVSAARRTGLPVTSSFHTNFDTYTAHYGLGLLRRPVQAYLRRFHNRTLLTLAPTQAMVEDLAHRDFRHVDLMARGVALGLFHPRRRDRHLRRQWGLDDSGLALVHVGRLAREKNLDTLLGAFAAIRRKRSDVRLILAGDGPMRAELERRCPQAIFMGVLKGEQLASCYASGDLFLFPSLSETYGNVVPEAMASGLAVLAYDRAAAAQLIRDDVNGALVRAADESAFLARASALAADPAALDRLRSQAPGAVAHLDWEAVTDQFLRSLQEAISRSPVDRPAARPLITARQQGPMASASRPDQPSTGPLHGSRAPG